MEPEGSLPCQPNPLRPIDPYLPKDHLNVILPPVSLLIGTRPAINS